MGLQKRLPGTLFSVNRCSFFVSFAVFVHVYAIVSISQIYYISFHHIWQSTVTTAKGLPRSLQSVI